MRWSVLFPLLLACGGDDALTAEDCTADEVFATQCGSCGPTDECIDAAPVCAPTCETDGEACDGGGFCLDGACLQNVCG
jgi:hypothetical protein